MVAAIIYKNMGVSNEDIALYTSQMYLPWVLAARGAAWSPFKTKRWWVISMEFLMASPLGLVALVPAAGRFLPSVAGLFLDHWLCLGHAHAVADGVFMTTVN